MVELITDGRADGGERLSPPIVVINDSERPSACLIHAAIVDGRATPRQWCRACDLTQPAERGAGRVPEMTPRWPEVEISWRHAVVRRAASSTPATGAGVQSNADRSG